MPVSQGEELPKTREGRSRPAPAKCGRTPEHPAPNT